MSLYQLMRRAGEAGVPTYSLTVWLAAGGEIHPTEEPWPQGVEVIIDTLLGTGLKAAPCDPYCSLIAVANRHPAPVIALDIPSGL